MRTTILIDNTPDEQRLLEAEHGLAMLVETDDRRILIDTGLSGRFIDNARRAGISLAGLDFCFLSHGHNDHSGGLRRLLETFPETEVLLSERIFHEHYSTSRHGARRDLSTDAETLRKHADRLHPIGGSAWIADRIAAVGCSHDEYPKPLGNLFLSKEVGAQSVPDDFGHEMALAIATDRGLVVFSSCSHGGAINIMKSCQDFTGEQRIRAFVGGLHFVDCQQTEQEVAAFSLSLKATFPDTQIFTGHCTSDKAKRFLSEAVPTIRFFRTGEHFDL